MKTQSNLVLAVCILALTLLVVGLVSPALGLPAAGEIPPDLTPVAYLPYVAVARTPTPTPSPPDPTPAAYLPYVSVARIPTPTPTPTPAPPGPVGLKVYDVDGIERTYQWAVNKYGVRVEQIGGWAYHCVELREITGPAGVEVWLYQADGSPAANVRVEFWWPTDMDWRLTEASGKAGFGYGSGSWIWDPVVGGPHWLVVDWGGCDAVSRLGMLGYTNHDHLDVSYRYGYLWATP